MSKRSLAPLAAVLLCSLAGCRDPAASGPSIIDEGRAVFAPVGSGSSMSVVRLRLTAIELPVGAASGSEEIWGRLIAAPAGEVDRTRLALNGFRLGVGRQAAWDELAKALADMDGRLLKSNTMLIAPNTSAPVPLSRHAGAQTIFTFDRRSALTGVDYRPADNLLLLSCAVKSDDAHGVALTFVPQLRTLRDRTRFVRRAGRFASVRGPEVHSLHSLAWRVRLTDKDFLVIGPGTHSTRGTSPGAHFLLHETAGMRFETLLVMTIELLSHSKSTRPPAPPAKQGLALPAKSATTQPADPAQPRTEP